MDDNPYGDWEGDDYYDGERLPPMEPSTSDQELLNEILDGLGIREFGEIVIDLTAANPAEIRGDRFSTLEETVLFLYDIGILNFSNLIYFDDVDQYGYEVNYPEGTAP